MQQHIRDRIKKCGIKLTKNQIVHSIFLRRIFYFPVSQAWLIQSSPAQSIISKANLPKHNGIKTMTSYYINQDLITELHLDRLCNTYGSHVLMNRRKYQHSFKNGNKIQLCKLRPWILFPAKTENFQSLQWFSPPASLSPWTPGFSSIISFCSNSLYLCIYRVRKQKWEKVTSIFEQP